MTAFVDETTANIEQVVHALLVVVNDLGQDLIDALVPKIIGGVCASSWNSKYIQMGVS